MECGVVMVVQRCGGQDIIIVGCQRLTRFAKQIPIIPKVYMPGTPNMVPPRLMRKCLQVVYLSSFVSDRVVY